MYVFLLGSSLVNILNAGFSLAFVYFRYNLQDKLDISVNVCEPKPH